MYTPLLSMLLAQSTWVMRLAQIYIVCDGRVGAPVYALVYFIFIEVISTNFKSVFFS